MKQHSGERARWVMRHRNSFAGISAKWLRRAVVGAGKGAYLHILGSPLEFTQSLIASEFFIGLFFLFFICCSKVNRVAPQLWAK